MLITKSTIKIFFETHRRALFVAGVWLVIILLAYSTYVFSHIIKSRDYGAASVILSGDSQIHEVYLYADHAIPNTIKVKIGDTVRFVSKDDGFHDVSTRKDGTNNALSRLVSGEFGAGDSYELQFQNPGTFSFYDRLHLDTSVTIIVEK